MKKKKVLREDARNKYRNLSEIEKEKKKKSKKQISHDYWFKWKIKLISKKLLCFKKKRKKIKYKIFV